MIKTTILGVILIFLNVAIVAAQGFNAKQDPISKITEITAPESINNTFAYLSEVKNDASRAVLYQREKSPTIGVIYISLMSKKPVVYNGDIPPDYVDLFIDNTKISVRFIMTSRKETPLGFQETFLLVFCQHALRSLLQAENSDQVYFMLNKKAWIIDPLVRQQIVLLKEAGYVLS